MGSSWETSRAATLNFDETCKLLCAFVQKYFQELPWSGILIEYQRQEYVRLLQNANLKLNSDNTRICILLVFLEVKSSQAHLPSTFRFGILSCFNPAATFYFAFRQVCLHSRPPK